MLLVAGLDVAPAGMRAWVSDATGRLETTEQRPAPASDAEGQEDACRDLLAAVVEGRPVLDWLGLSVSGPAPDLASPVGELDVGWVLPAQLPVVRSDPDRLLVVGAGGLDRDVVTVVLGERRASVWREDAVRRDLAPEAVAGVVEQLAVGATAVVVTGRGQLPVEQLAVSLAAALGRPVHVDPRCDALVVGAAYVVTRAVGAHAHRPGLPERTT